MDAQSLISDDVAGEPLPLVSSVRYEPFGYSCNRCLRCCHHKHIQVNPYEVARIARNRAVSTTECRTRWTVDAQGIALAQTVSGACVLLGRDGCTVHADRPLVCRLYPLGRHVASDGNEHFSHLEPHPQSAGEYTQRGTIAEFLASQDAAAYMDAADDYYHWLNKTQQRVLGAPTEDSVSLDTPVLDALRYLDMDVAIADYCTTREVPEPTDLEARRLLHIDILDGLLNLDA